MFNLDHNATTPLDPMVWGKIAPLIEKGALNPSSPHLLGREARRLVIESKDRILKSIGCSSGEVLFTSSATEALNTALFSLKPGMHVITSKVEHLALLAPIRVLEKNGVHITYLESSASGSWSLDDLTEALEKGADLVALGAANHETGVIHPYFAASQICALRGVPFLLDAVGLLGRGIWRFPEGEVAVCISAHKIHGPQGCGALVYSKGFPLFPLIHGGKQQRGLRSGTENVSAIVGLGYAMELIPSKEVLDHIASLRDLFERELSKIHSVTIVGQQVVRVVNTSSVVFHGVDAEWLFMELDLNGVASSFGSACSSNGRELSHVLAAMGFSMEAQRSSLRFSLSRMSTRDEIEGAIEIFAKIFSKVPAF